MYKGNKMNNDFSFKKTAIDKIVDQESFRIKPTTPTGNNMVRKRITITIHQIELSKLKKIAKENKETVSGMISRLIQQYK